MDDDTYCPRFRYDMYRYLKSLGDAAPYLDVTKLVETGEYTQEPEAYAKYIRGGLESFRRRPLDVPPGEWEKPCPDYAEHPARQAFLREVVDAMDAAGVAAILYPTWTNPPAHIHRAFEEYKGDNSQLIASDTGMPAVTVPMGTSYGNLPAGLQILGRPYSEGLLIQYAYAYEQATHHRRPPLAFPELGR